MVRTLRAHLFEVQNRRGFGRGTLPFLAADDPMIELAVLRRLDRSVGRTSVRIDNMDGGVLGGSWSGNGHLGPTLFI